MVRFIADRIAVIHLGKIVEIAESETLFKYPIHPYTVSLLSAVPMPDPIIEKQRESIVYTKAEDDPNASPREMREIRPGHFVYANDEDMVAFEDRLKKLESYHAE